MSKPQSAIAIANEQVSILSVLGWIGIPVPEIPEGRSLKIRCPFGEIAHADRGMKPEMRIYPFTNSVYCFQCGYFSPTSLAAQVWGGEPEQVALTLLDRVGYKPLSLAQLWENVSEVELQPNTADLGLALRIYGERICTDWDQAQFEPAISYVLGRCLSLLSSIRTEDGAQRWLLTCKVVLKTALERR